MDISVVMLELGMNAQTAGATVIDISLKRAERGVILTVRDNGSGIDEKALALLLKAGYSTSGGSGLGLLKSAEYAEATGGSLEIASKEGVGTTVEARFGEGTVTGDISGTVAVLAAGEAEIRFAAESHGKTYTLDTSKLRESFLGASQTAFIAEIKKDIKENLI